MSIKTKIVNQVDVNQIGGLISQYKYGRYCEDPSLSIERTRYYMSDYVREYVSHADSKCILAFSSSEKLLGALSFKLSDWDTEHFGFKVAIIDLIMTIESGYDQKRDVTKALLKEFDRWCKSDCVRFTWCKVPALNIPAIHSFEDCGYRYAETWIYNKYDLKAVDTLKKVRYSLRLARTEDYSWMIKYSRNGFSTQRFHADPHISIQKAESLYEKWIRTAFQDSKQEILTLDIKGRPVAFMTYYKNDLSRYFGLRFAKWRMLLADPDSRGKGIGTDFFIALLQYHRKDGLDVVDSELSMRNLISLNLHTKVNFRVIGTLVTFHKWMDK